MTTTIRSDVEMTRFLNYFVVNVWELMRFGFVGGLTFLINFLTFTWLFSRLQLDYRVAATGAYFVTVCCHFTLHKLFTFDAGRQQLTKNIPRYIGMLALNYVITLAAFWLTVEVFRIAPLYGVVVSTASTAFSSYVVMKYVVFKRVQG